MAYPTGLETFELTTIQLTRVMYAVEDGVCLRTRVFDFERLPADVASLPDHRFGEHKDRCGFAGGIWTSDYSPPLYYSHFC